ncbi:histidine kinase [Methylobacterium indicum]|uniref:PAS domain-containing protein n=1 Tax=Methylobacterium indicum TaxID=1775910 RepID=UPI00073412BD|nr:PAS domain-containing protein [Methylobacterium indicum]KTS34230.1 histidine kinase [Methylobacterium indicum]KTS41785.1 histidine kinase [Methylobacterium indicum]KTS53118.1 histidine kinase [Methylobacterium indicum]
MATQAERDRLAFEIVRKVSGGDPFSAAVRATRMPMLITDPHQPDNPIIFVNDAFTKLTGYAREEIIGRNCRFLQGPKTDPGDVARIREAVRDRRQIELDLLNYRKNGETFWNRLLIAPVFDDESGEMNFFFASQFDVTLERERLVRLQQDRDALEAAFERRTAALSDSERRLRFVLKAGRMGTCTVDLQSGYTVASDGCKAIFGRRADETFQYADLLAMIHPDDIERMQATLAASVDAKADYEVEYRVDMPSGEVRWVEVRGQPFYAPDGTPLSMVCVSLDITDRKRLEEHRAFLARELDHRVKNTLATVQSITNQTLRTASSMAEAQERIGARLKSLASAHDVLTREKWDGATIAEIVVSALAPFTQTGVSRIRTGGPDVRLPPRSALALSMALHELATNAVKYGALSNDAGHVRFDWDIVGGTPGRLWLRWEEFNGPAIASPERQGFGSRLIQRTLATELAGKVEMDFRPTGLVFTAEAPLPDPLTSSDEPLRTD